MGRSAQTDPRRILVDALVDYAGLFPPAGHAMEEALREYRREAIGPHAPMLGRFVVPVARLPELRVALEAEGEWEEPGDTRPAPHLRVSAILGSDPHADRAEIDAFHRSAGPRARVESIEARVADPAGVAGIGAICPPLEGWELWFEIPAPAPSLPGRAPSEADLARFRAIREVGGGAKVRTGGITPDAFPGPDPLLAFLEGCVREGIPFKATAGLHHLLRGAYPLTGAPDAPRVPMFGFLNLLLATGLLLRGAGNEAARAALLESDLESVSFADGVLHWGAYAFDTAAITALRRQALRSFGSCSFHEPAGEFEGAFGSSGTSPVP